MKKGFEEDQKPTQGQSIQKILISDLIVDGSNTNASKSSKPKTYLDRFKDQFQDTFDQGSSSKYRRGSHMITSNFGSFLQQNNQKFQAFSKCDLIVNSPYTRGRSQSFNQKKEQFQDSKYILDLSKEEDQEILKNTLQLKNQMSEFQLEMLKRTFGNLKIFVDLEKQMKRHEYIKMIQNFGFLKLQKGSVVFEFGDLGEKYFIILKGSVYILLKTNYGETVRKMKPTEEENNSQENNKTEINEKRIDHLSPFGKQNINEKFEFGDQKMYGELFIKRSRQTMVDFDLDSEPDLECKGVSLKQEIKQKYPHFSIVASHYEGEGFGEYSLIKNIRRTATIITSQDTVFATVDKNEYNELMKDHIETIFQHKIQFLKSFKIFESQEKKLSNLVMCFQSIFYQRGDFIYKEQDESNSLYFIQNGEVEISTYEQNLKSSNQNEEDQQELDDQQAQLNRLFLISSQKQKRVKKRVILALLNDKNYFGEEEIILKQKKRKTQAKVISAEFQGLKISLKNFLLLCRFTDVMKKLRQNYKMKQEWRDSYQVNCKETIQKFKLSNYSSLSPPRQQEEVQFSQTKIESANKSNNINSNLSFITNVKISQKILQSPILRANKFGVSEELYLSQKSQAMKSQSKEHENKYHHEQSQNNTFQQASKTTIQFAEENNKVQTNCYIIPKDNMNGNNLINLQNFLSNQDQTSINGHLSSVSNQFNFSQSLSPVSKGKNQYYFDQRQESLFQSDMNKSSQYQSTCFSPIQKSNVNIHNQNHIQIHNINAKARYSPSLLSSYDTNQKIETNHSNQKFSSQIHIFQIKFLIQILSDDEKVKQNKYQIKFYKQKNFKLNLQQLGNSRPITPSIDRDDKQISQNLNGRMNKETIVQSNSLLVKNGYSSELQNLKTLPSKELVSIINEQNMSFQNDLVMKNFQSLIQSFYSNTSFASPVKSSRQKQRAYSTGKKKNVSINLSDCYQNQNGSSQFQENQRLNTSPSKNSIAENETDQTNLCQINQGFTYFKINQQNDGGAFRQKGKKNIQPISSSDIVDEQFLLRKYAQKFDSQKEAEGQLLGVQLQDNSYLVYNYQKIHQKLMVNSNLIKSNEKGRRMMQYYNDVQKCQTGHYKKFISPFIFYKEKNKATQPFYNNKNKYDERKLSLHRTTNSEYQSNQFRNKSMDASLEGRTNEKYSQNQTQTTTQQNNEKTDYKLIFLRKKLQQNQDFKDQIKQNLALRISPLKIQSQQNSFAKQQKIRQN